MPSVVTAARAAAELLAVIPAAPRGAGDRRGEPLPVDDQDLYTIVITTYIPPRQVGDGPWTPWYADYYHPEV